MLATLSVVFLTVVPSQDAPPEAFKAMEQQVLKAKSIQMDLEVAIENKGSTLKGRLQAAQGNKVRLDLEGTRGGKPSKMTMASDGTKMRITWSEVSRQSPAPDTAKQMTDIILASVTRSGVFAPLFMISEGNEPGGRLKDFDINKDFAVSDFKFGKKEMVAGKEAQVLEYKFTVKGATQPVPVTLWIDTKTNLPLKRVLQILGETVTITETYGKLVLDENIDDKEFALPK